MNATRPKKHKKPKKVAGVRYSRSTGMSPIFFFLYLKGYVK